MPSTHRYTWSNTYKRALFAQHAAEKHPIDTWVSFFWPDCSRTEHQARKQEYITVMWKALSPIDKASWTQQQKDLRVLHNIQKPVRRARVSTPIILNMSDTLTQQLVSWRTNTQHTHGVKAATIITDAAIHDIATNLPTTWEALLHVKGIGYSKRDKYGRAILHIVQQSS